MPNIRIITWNINSVRARIHHVETVVKTLKPDVLCLQETKVMDEAFPRKAFASMGFENLALRGQKSHHGVAIASHLPFEKSESLDWCGMNDARHTSIKIHDTTIHNFYVPAGGEEPDPTINPKFRHKLDFLDEMTLWSERLTGRHVLLGDLNVAPLETDVWSHKALLKVVSHTPTETERLAKLQQSHNWVDAMRHFVPEDKPLFSWWSYRARDWRASNKGRRLDHVWVSPDLKPGLKSMQLYDLARDWEKPSDHIPVVVDIAL